MIQIQNLTKAKISTKSFSQVAKTVLSGENRGKETVSLVFVDKAEIHRLNKQFRGKDMPTDVLSFNLDEGSYIGELVVCPEIVKEQAKTYQVTEQYEMTKMIIHGILHLLGYDHERSKRDEEIMEAKQEYYLKKCNV